MNLATKQLSTNQKSAILHAAIEKQLIAHLTAGGMIAYHSMSAGPLRLATGERRYAFVPGTAHRMRGLYYRPFESDDPALVARRWMLHVANHTTARLLARENV